MTALTQRWCRLPLSFAAVGLAAVVASGIGSASASADACPNAQLRSGSSAHLPDCRAYEQVSPVDKNGSDISYGPATSSGPLQIQDSGDAALFRSLGAFAGTPWGGGQSVVPYFARRSPSGWQTQPLVGRPQNTAAETTISNAVSPDFTKVLLRAGDALVPNDPAPTGGDVALYSRNTVNRDLELVTTAFAQDFKPLKWFPDSSRLTFTTPDVLPPGDPDIPSEGKKAYAPSPGGDPELISVVGGAPTTGQVGNFGQTASQRSLSNAITHDSQHVFFTSPLPGSGTTPGLGDSATNNPMKIYRRTPSAQTSVLVSPSQRTDCADDPTCDGNGVPEPEPDPAGERAKGYETATPDGRFVFFISAEQLTDEANTGGATPRPGQDLYRYDVRTDELVDLSVDTVSSAGARAQGVVGASDDGRWVYYVALGTVVTTAGITGQPPVDGQPNLYLWHDDGSADGETRFISTLVPSAGFELRDSVNWAWSDEKASRLTADGQRLLFQSELNLTSHPNAGNTLTKVFLYDAQGAGGAGALRCVSCNPHGTAPLGGADLGRVFQTGVEEPDNYIRTMAEGGDRVFFTSGDSLVGRDINGREDAYMWENGALHLLSSGQSTDDSRFYGASVDGDEAFFLTREQLVGWDGDTGLDLYVAKVGGGFPEPVPPTLCNLLGDECQRPGVNPVSTPVETSTPLSDGNAKSGRRGTTAKRRLVVTKPSARARRRAARRGVLALRVRSRKAGRIRAVARARIRGRMRRIGRDRAAVRRGRRAVVRMRLSRPARRRLRTGSRLRVRVRVNQRGVRPDALVMTLRRERR